MSSGPTPESRLSEAASELGKALESLDVPYAIIGGVAISLMARPRLTADLDAVIGDILDRLPEVVLELTRLGFAARVPDPVAFAATNLVLLVRSPSGVPVDLSIGLTGFEQVALSRALTLRLATGSLVRVCRPVDLAVMKALADRSKDMDDLKEIVVRCTEREREEALATTSALAELLGTRSPTDRLEAALKSLEGA